MKLKPIITEKTMKQAKAGKYSFYVNREMTKPKIKELVEKVFRVKVTGVRTAKIGREVKITLARRKKVIAPKKKAIVTLEAKDKIDLFESKKS